MTSKFPAPLMSINHENGDTHIMQGGTAVTIHADGRTEIITTQPVAIQTPAGVAQAASPTEPTGSRQENGSIYAGKIHGQKLYAAPTDAEDGAGRRLPFTSEGAARYAEVKNDRGYLGYNDWHVPNLEEMEVLAANQREGALTGTFNKECVYQAKPFNTVAGELPPHTYPQGYDFEEKRPVSLKEKEVGILRLVRRGP